MVKIARTCCPHCGNSNIDGGKIYPKGDAEDAFRSMDCNNCGATWLSCYKLYGYDNLKVPA
jgi:hypothetical protein